MHNEWVGRRDNVGDTVDVTEGVVEAVEGSIPEVNEV